MHVRVALIKVSAIAMLVAVAAGLAASAPAAPRHAGASLTSTVSVAPACRLRTVGERAFLPPLLRSRRAPSGEILARVGVLRPPPTPADRVNLRRFDRWPFEVLAVYVRYIRVLDGPHGARIALIPSRICSPPVRFPPPAHIRVAPRDVLLMQVLSNPPTFRPTVWIGTATDVREGRANGFLDNASPPHTGVLVTIVPDGVSRVVFRFPRHRPRTAAAVVDGNVAIANPIPQFFPETTIWYDASGTVIRRIHAPSPR